jgi:molecular chaperone DnaJ
VTRDLYEVLGVARSATPADLKKAYRSLAQLHHPDKNPGDKAAEEKFKEAANAYQILSDEEKRATYDRYGLDGVRRGGAGGPDNGAGFGGFNSVEDVFSTFGDLFGDFFAGRNARRATRGADLKLDLSLTFREAVWGTRKDIEATRTAGCASCRSTGAAKGARAELCRACQGKGQVVHAQGFFMVQTTCAQCNGAGKLVKDPCPDCRGRGVRSETSALSLTVPPGVDDGQTLRVGGKGEVVPGGAAGDLFVALHVQADDRFEREGDDVTSEVSISFAQAALGGEVEIDTLDNGCTGTTLLELRPGTQPGDEVVRRGQGIPHVGDEGRGDHTVRFVVEVPRKLTAKQEKLLREFAEELGDDRARTKKRSRR